MKNYPSSRLNNLVVQEMSGEILIYDLAENKAFCLNETSALVWNLCDGKNSIAEISESVSKKLKSPVNEDLVWLALDQLKKENLIVSEYEVPETFSMMSRREVVRKIGLGSMIALPVIASIVAPTAITAQSCAGAMTLTENQFCTTSCQCRGRETAAGSGVFFPSVCCDAPPAGGTPVCRENGGACLPGTTI